MIDKESAEALKLARRHMDNVLAGALGAGHGRAVMQTFNDVNGNTCGEWSLEEAG